MAILTAIDAGVRLTNREEITAFLAPFGLWYERWDVEGRVGADASSEEILSAYDPELQRLKQTGGYVTADVIDVTAQTPGLDAMLEMFNKEHTHSEDEVRFVVRGSGIFHIHADSGDVFSIEMSSGDMINVPSGTRHWFNLCSDRTIRAIRLFKDKSGWTPYYIENGVHDKYQPVCFGPTYIAGKKSVESVIKP